jgi:tetratricopeptide (TPR) repeat protein
MGLIDPNTMDADADKYPADENIARLQEKLKYRPENVSYRYTLGMLYENNGQMDKAQKEFQTALTIEPESIDVLNASAIVYVNKMQYQDAILTFKRLIDIQPENNIFHYNISCLYAIQNMENESIEWLTKAIANGYNNRDHLKNDKDLENIRHTPYFKSLVDNIH